MNIQANSNLTLGIITGIEPVPTGSPGALPITNFLLRPLLVLQSILVRTITPYYSRAHTRIRT